MISEIPDDIFERVYSAILKHGLVFHVPMAMNSNRYQQLALKRYEEFDFDKALELCKNRERNLERARSNRDFGQIIREHSAWVAFGDDMQYGFVEKLDLFYFLYANRLISIVLSRKNSYIKPAKFEQDLIEIVNWLYIGRKRYKALKDIKRFL